MVEEELYIDDPYYIFQIIGLNTFVQLDVTSMTSYLIMDQVTNKIV